MATVAIAEPEPPGDVACHGAQRAGLVGGQQHVAAQVEEARDLVASVDRLGGARPRRGREMAGHDGHHQEGAERHPVVGVGHGEGPHRGHEEEVQAKQRRQ